MKYGLIGERLPHSFSAQIHGAFGRYDYELRELPPAELGPFLQKRDFLGLNVTIPYKQAVIPYLDELSPDAAAIGAVNTVVNRGGRLLGDNTDLGGLLALLRRADIRLAGRKVLILGTGGTGRTAFAAAQRCGAGEILRVSRRPGPGAIDYETARRDHRDAGVIINTTPVGMYPDTEGCPVDPDDFPDLAGVADVVYNPLRTTLVLRARSRGIPAAGGLYMLVTQAALACERFTGQPVAPEQTEEIFAALCRSRQNLVLIGMPGSGKSTVGALLSRQLGLPVTDTDAVIEARAGRPIPEIFAAEGETAFRDLETEVIRDLSRTGGQILSTGGGSILRPRNVLALRRSGRLFFLDRPLAELLPTADRPLGDSREKLARLYAQRYERYLACADERIPVAGDAETAAREILTRWRQDAL